MGGTVLGFLFGFGFLMFALIIAWYVLQVVAYWRIFTKAGEAGWKSLIPIYNTYVQYRITWHTNFFWVWLVSVLITAFCPSGGTVAAILTTVFGLITFVLSALSQYKLSLAFGHGVGFAIGLFFIEPIFLMILGFGSSQYLGPQQVYNEYF